MLIQLEHNYISSVSIVYTFVAIMYGGMTSISDSMKNSRHCLEIKSPATGDLTMACWMMYPSWTGIALVCVAPESMIRPVDRPFAKHESTAFLHKKNAGTLYFSNINSVNFSLLFLMFH